MTAPTRSRVVLRTSGELLMTRDTVFFETLASLATSLIVGLRRSALPEACGFRDRDFFLAGTGSCDRSGDAELALGEIERALVVGLAVGRAQAHAGDQDAFWRLVASEPIAHMHADAFLIEVVW